MAKDFSKTTSAALDTWFLPEEDAQEPEKAVEEISRPLPEDNTTTPMLNPAEGETEDEGVSKTRTPEELVGGLKQETTILSQFAPKGYRLVYRDGSDYGELIETKSKKFQILFTPYLHKAVKTRAKKEKISINEYAHRVLSRYAHLDEEQQQECFSASWDFARERIERKCTQRKTQRFELLVQPSVFDAIQKCASKHELSIGNVIHMLLDYDLHNNAENTEKE